MFNVSVALVPKLKEYFKVWKIFNIVDEFQCNAQYDLNKAVSDYLKKLEKSGVSVIGNVYDGEPTLDFIVNDNGKHNCVYQLNTSKVVLDIVEKHDFKIKPLTKANRKNFVQKYIMSESLTDRDKDILKSRLNIAIMSYGYSYKAIKCILYGYTPHDYIINIVRINTIDDFSRTDAEKLTKLFEIDLEVQFKDFLGYATIRLYGQHSKLNLSFTNMRIADVVCKSTGETY